MSTGEWLTRATVWLAILLYVLSEAAFVRRADRQSSSPARWLNTLGGMAFLAHVAFSFHYFYQWSHAVGYAETARQTRELFGIDWGGGIFFNYAFTLVWLTEMIWWWASAKSYQARARWMNRSVRGFFIFMIFNGAVIFPPSPIRWLGLALCVMLAAIWWRAAKSQAGQAAPP